MIKLSFHLVILSLLISSCGSGSNSGSKSGKVGFSTRETSQGIELAENGDPVFFYQRIPKSGDGEHYFNNYIHPLYNLNGDTISEEFPEDHFHHRGIFWAWHQLFMGDLNLGDQWMMDGISQEVTDVSTELSEDVAVFSISVSWHSSVMDNDEPFLDEQTIITVHPRKENLRIIDFDIALTSLVPGLKLGGSDDEKGYGGFSARLKMPDDLVFTSETGEVKPQKLQLQAGPWMDFSGSLGSTHDLPGETHEPNGVTIICHPNTPNYPGTWILRQNNSMQNIVFPGQKAVHVPIEKLTVLKYRMIIHSGNAKSLDLDRLFDI